MSASEIKLVLIGNSGAGKSCIVHRAITGQFDENMQATLGASYLSKTIHYDNKDYRLQIWDTAGQEKYKGLAPLYFRGSNVAFIVYSVSDRSSFDGVDAWVNRLKESTDTPVSVFLIANKIDMINNIEVQSINGQQKAEEIGAKFYEVSAKTGEGIDDLFAEVPEIFSNCSNVKVETVLKQSNQTDKNAKKDCC